VEKNFKRNVIQVYFSPKEKEFVQIESIKAKKTNSDFCKEIILKHLKYKDNKKENK
jgi:hypothetical protein